MEKLWHSWGYKDPYTPMPNMSVQTISAYYYAAVEFMDYTVGRVLNELDSLGLTNNTIIVIHGDHGYQLGERNEWLKHTMWEEAARVPLIISVPWMKNSVGKRTSALVELLDLYPTLAELTGVPLPKTDSAPVQGTSFASVFKDPTLDARKFAMTQHPRCPPKDGKIWERNICVFTPRNEFGYMGYSIRTNEWRYTEWPKWNGATLKPEWSTVANRTELYDHRTDTETSLAFEHVNVAAQNPTITAQLSQLLRQAVDS
jgi:arylsulfatase A-like enzyme